MRRCPPARGAVLTGAVAVAVEAALAVALAAAPLVAQDWQLLDARRTSGDSTPMHVRLVYGVGTLRVGPAEPGVLYDVRLRYDASRMEPQVEWRAASRTLRIQTRLERMQLPGGDGADLSVRLSRLAPLDLDVQVGAVEAQLDLTGLRVRSLDFASGASEATVRFDTAGTTPLERLAVQVGAGTLRVEGLGHAQVRRIDASGGVGELVLDFAGAWTGDVDADLSLAIGKATLIVPADVGVRIDGSARWLNRLDLPGFEPDGDARVSPGYAQARRRLRVDLASVLGTVRVERR